VEVLCTDVGDRVQEKSDRGVQTDVRLQQVVRTEFSVGRTEFFILRTEFSAWRYSQLSAAADWSWVYKGIRTPNSVPGQLKTRLLGAGLIPRSTCGSSSLRMSPFSFETYRMVTEMSIRAIRVTKGEHLPEMPISTGHRNVNKGNPSHEGRTPAGNAHKHWSQKCQ
jgi:hypothetical protein